MINWYKSQSNVRPMEVDLLSTSSGVYLRKNIEPLEENIEGKVLKGFKYDEALLTHQEYEGYVFATEFAQGDFKVGDKPSLAQSQRINRNQLLEATDKFMLADYPITAEVRNNYILYRSYLRNIPEDNNFPDVKIKTFAEWKQSI